MRFPDEPLFGRERDVECLRVFIEDATVHGGALVISGDAGVGKTVLLEVVAANAIRAGRRVLRATGAQFEANLSFAGLNQLLYPLFDGLERLSPTHRRALSAALGLVEGARSDQLVVSNAVLELLRQSATERPLVAIVDDLHWLDRASAVVLAFVARRLTGSPTAFLAAFRTGEETFFERAGLQQLDLQPLDAAASTLLLADRFPALAPRVRERLLNEAEGNPLALLELPVSLSNAQRAALGALPLVLPLGRRLQAVFASRINQLPAGTRHLLLLAVLDGTGDLRVLQVATTRQDIEALVPAERARLIHLDASSRRLVFRHPLIRSAVVELSTIDERREVHQVLAERSVHEPERRAWHLAEAAVGPDEDVAALLQGVAHDTLRRGDAVGGIAILLRSAELSPGGSDRSIRLAEAAYLGATVHGDLRHVPALLDAARQADREHGGSLAGAVAAAYHLLNGDGDVDSAHRLLVGAIEALPDPGDAHNKTLHEALYNLLVVCFFGGRAELWEPLHSAVRRLVPRPPDVLDLLDKTFGDPARVTPGVLVRLETAIAGVVGESSPARIVRIGIAAAYVDRLPGCRGALRRVVEHGRDGGAITSAIEALFLLGNDAYFTGQWNNLAPLLEEGLALSQAHGYRLLVWPGLFLQALLSAARGDEHTTRALTDEMTRWAEPRRVRAVLNYAAHARALAALGRGDFETAYQHASAVSPAGVLASHVPHALWLVMDLVEAAVRTRRHAEAAAHVAAARDAHIDQISPRLALVVNGAAAMVASDDEQADLFEAALAIPDASRWPFDHARIQLAYGERLRRTKVTASARTHLTTALEIFERLNAQPWVARASSELRAAGLPIEQPRSLVTASMTPQQREIAMLAARGLTNKQIGERLFLSPRTVATHLYQLFPKLGVTSRAALRDALTRTAHADVDADQALNRYVAVI